MINYYILISVQLDSPVTVACERTYKLISKVISINSQQFVRIKIILFLKILYKSFRIHFIVNNIYQHYFLLVFNYVIHLLPCMILSMFLFFSNSFLRSNPSSFMFNIRSIFTLFISLLDLVRPQAEYL